MNDWLRATARQHQDKDLSRTYVATFADKPGKVAGYYALAATLVQTEGMEGKRLPREVSAVLIARLAVDQHSQGMGVGECLLMNALDAAVRAAEIIGVQCVVVDALDDRAARFYQQYGFVPLIEQPRRLFLALDTIRKLFD